MKTNSFAAGFLRQAAAALLVAGPGMAGTLYVDLNSPAPTAPYLTWATAATNIQDAVDAATAGDNIVVTNGSYQVGARAVYGMSNRVAVTKPLTLQSVNGAGVTTIVGYQVPGTTNGARAVRCVYLTNGAALVGFALTNGATQTGESYKSQSGGGVWCESSSAVLSNCVLTGNSAGGGGGAYAGTLNNCMLVGNSAANGGRAYGGILNNCTLVGNQAALGAGANGGTLNDCTLRDNSARHLGGGAYGGTLNNCALTGNSAFEQGGGAYGTVLNNCTLMTNSCGQRGGGADGGTLSGCTLSGNSANYGGGAANCILSNCTLTANSAGSAGGAAFSGTLNNCTLASNWAASSGGGASGGTLNNCTLAGNWALGAGGGVSGGTLWGCTLTGNWATNGGGADSCTLNNCTLTGNSASQGGGAASGTLNNCSLTGNSVSASGGGVYSATLNNCIVYYNSARFSGDNYDASSKLNYCCTTPLPSGGTGNLTQEPELASDSHLSAGSACRGAGSASYATGLDIDGEPWATPPSIGCDEYWSGMVTGAVSAAIVISYTNVAVGFETDLRALIGGRVSASRWDFGDGIVLSNRPYASHVGQRREITRWNCAPIMRAFPVV